MNEQIIQSQLQGVFPSERPLVLVDTSDVLVDRLDDGYGDPETADHARLLESRTRDTLLPDDFSMGYHPFHVTTPAANAYFMPALIRIALSDIQPDGEAGEKAELLMYLLLHSTGFSPSNFTEMQREAVINAVNLLGARLSQDEQTDLNQILIRWSQPAGAEE